ncbi:MAG TPA: glycosyltransferase family protein, partial [Dyadobacter sp.]|nr:glycosyltransferase family protein [Dyadobacter sp.]
MKILFLVQGEGRGHMTQAISLGQILRGAGHQVAGVLVGKATDRVIPSFFAEQIKAPVYEFIAPAIVYNQGGKGMNVGSTVYALFKNAGKYIRELRTIHDRVNKIKPDLIISFYETYSGLYNIIFRPEIPMLCIAHQYLLMHPKFVFPKNSTFNRFLINLNSKAASWLAHKRLALSFREMEA